MCTYAENDVEELADSLEAGKTHICTVSFLGRVGIVATNDLLVECLLPWGTSVWFQGLQLLGCGPATFCRAICFTKSPLISVLISPKKQPCHDIQTCLPRQLGIMAWSS